MKPEKTARRGAGTADNADRTRRSRPDPRAPTPERTEGPDWADLVAPDPAYYLRET